MTCLNENEKTNLSDNVSYVMLKIKNAIYNYCIDGYIPESLAHKFVFFIDNIEQDFENITTELDEYKVENAKLESWIDALQMEKSLTCTYCGNSFDPAELAFSSFTPREILEQHARSCEKHPMHALSQENAELRQIVSIRENEIERYIVELNEKDDMIEELKNATFGLEMNGNILNPVEFIDLLNEAEDIDISKAYLQLWAYTLKLQLNKRD